MSLTKFRLSNEEEEKLIEFVKKNEMIFNVNNKEYRNTEKKKLMWLEFADSIGHKEDVDKVRRKWVAIRDYFMQKYVKHPTGSDGATYSKREESLLFLLNTPKFKHISPITNVATATVSNEQDEEDTKMVLDPLSNQYDIDSFVFDHNKYEDETSNASYTSETPSIRTFSKNSPQSSAELLREFLNASRTQPRPNNFLPPPQPKDNLSCFFESIADTMRMFPPLSIANLKMKISQLVGEEEIALITSSQLPSKYPPVQIVYLDQPQTSSTSTVTTPNVDNNQIDFTEVKHIPTPYGPSSEELITN